MSTFCIYIDTIVMLRVYARKGQIMASFNDNLKAAIELLPKAGDKVKFDEYKAKLYDAQPDSGQAVFARLIKQDLIGKELADDGTGKPVLMVFRLS